MIVRPIVLFGFVLLAGCGTKPAVAPPDLPVDPNEPFPREVRDGTGYATTLKTKPLRIVSTAPSNTEILFALGAGDRLVGVTTYCTYPPEAAAIPKIGGFAPSTISSETLVALKPDLVLTTGLIQDSLTDNLRKVGLTVLSFDAATLDEVLRNIRLLGEATGRGAAAAALVDDLKRRAEKVKARLAGLTVEQRPKVFLLLGESPLMTVGPKTFPGQILEAAGGRNLFADTVEQYPKISEEVLLSRKPDAIVAWSMNGPSVGTEALRKKPGWADFPALKHNRVYQLDDDLLSRPGPRLFDGLEWLAETLHPTAKR